MVIFGGKLSDAKKRAPNQVPLFLEKSLVYVEQNLGVDCEGIFRVSGSLENIKRIKEAIERGGGDVDYDKTPVRDTHEVAGIVKLYFRELAEPLVPTSLMKDFVKVGANENNSLNEPSVIGLLSRLPPDNYATMKRLMLFLKKLSEFSATTKMTADNLALVFSPNLLRDASSGYQEMMWSGHISSIVCFMITRANSLFPDSSTMVPPPKLQTPAVPPPIKRPPSVTTRKTLSAVDLSSYTLKGEFRVGMAHNLPNPPACLQGCNWGPLTQTGKVSVHASNESSSVIILIVGDEGRPIAQGIPANVMDTSDSSRYFVIPKTSNAIIVPGQEVGIGYIGVALYTPEDSMTFRGLVDVYRPQEFITHKPNQNGTFVLNTQQQQQQQQQQGHPRTLTNAPPMRPPFRKPVPAASVERYVSGTTYRKIINMSLDDEELIVYERVVQLSYANVFRCSIGPLCCMVKIFAKPDDKIIQYTLQEHANKIKHPNLLRSLGSQFEENIFCTFYEYCGNNSVWELMYRHKVEENPLPYRDIKHYATMVAKALAYLHENNTPHRDIKSCNVFLDGDEEPFQVVKLGDVCSSLALNIQWPIMYTSTFPYTPPEVLEDSARLQNNEDAFKVDIWQFGMLLVELETLGMPFEGMSEDDTQNSILTGRLPPSLPPSSPFLPLIQQCLRVDPQERLSADLIVQHLSKLSV